MLPIRSYETFRSFDMDGELAVFHPVTDRHHVLGCISTFVFRHCDGEHTVEQLSRMLSAEFGSSIGMPDLLASLRQLREADLVHGAASAPAEMPAGVVEEEGFSPYSGRNSVRGLPRPGTGSTRFRA